jgi:hypothetical protein
VPVYAYRFFVGWDSTLPLHLKDVLSQCTEYFPLLSLSYITIRKFMLPFMPVHMRHHSSKRNATTELLFALEILYEPILIYSLVLTCNTLVVEYVRLHDLRLWSVTVLTVASPSSRYREKRQVVGPPRRKLTYSRMIVAKKTYEYYYL